MPVLNEENAQRDNFVWYGSPLTRLVARVGGLLWRWSGDCVGLRPFLGRYTSHIALVLLFGLLLTFSGLRWDFVRAPWGQTLHSQNVALGREQAARVPSNNYVASGLQTAQVRAQGAYPSYRMSSQVHISRRAEPETAIPDRPRLDITTYVVQAGDTTEKIAELYGLQPTTIMWSNPEIEKAPDLLRIGQVLIILPVDGVYHTVEEGDTLDALAEKYKVSMTDIVNCPFNENLEVSSQTTLTHSVLVSHDKLIIPGGTKPYQRREVTKYEGPVPEEVSGSGAFYWPAAGYISQGYWYGHRAIDVADAVGAAVMAADDGYVSFAGWTDIGYGYLVVVDHANGYQSYYAHLSNIFVFEGEVVTAGQVIGAMGSTGNSTGPHLHFEIRYDGYPTNPLIYLP